MNKQELDDHITNDWREDQEFDPNCKYYNQEEDVCEFPKYPGNEKIFGKGCLGNQCINFTVKDI